MTDKEIEAKFYYNGEKITKKKAIELFGESKLNTRIEDAKETFREDPNIQIEWMDGLRIEFR